ncbi:suppressor of cytokine signaling 7-like [Asterias rubens]|uniref:suppressor of cytokine signaling 7-like n=1 Tax=Asterias rubens TaxID=7604 RepID=UPI00145583F1|nr:suppressor of cytokine signaling 7-like [Asterias rubens]
MVLEKPTTIQMSGLKKLSVRRSMKLPFGRKSSSKKSPNNSTSSSENNDGVVVILPIPESYMGEEEQNNSNDTEPGGKTTPSTAKLPSGKSHKWLFKNRRSESRSGEKRGPKISADLKYTEECDEPGSNSREKYKDSTALTNGDILEAEPVDDDQSKNPSTYHDSQSKLCGKGVGYVTPLRMGGELEYLLVEMKQKKINKECCACGDSDTNNVINGHKQYPEEGDNDAHIKVHETEDNFQENLDNRSYMRPPPPLFSTHTSPPRIPPKPAALRNRPLPAFAQGGSEEINNEELDNCEMPPRPPARPKNRALGKVAARPWQLGSTAPIDNRATVYEIVGPAPYESSLANELAKLPRQPWYWGPLTQAQAEEKLSTLPDGNFLVRDSSDERYLLSLSFNSHGRTLHTRIEHRNGLFSLNDSDGHTSIVELIECAVKESRSGVYGYMRDALGVQSFPARLTDWVSRFTEMRSLQHLCRFLIREVYPRHHIQMLPLPKKIKEYILENQY